MSLGWPFAFPWGNSKMRLRVSYRGATICAQAPNVPLVPAARELWPLLAPILLAPLLEPPRLGLEVLDLEAEVRHGLGGERLGWDESVGRPVWRTTQQQQNVPSRTLGSSSTSIGAGLSSMIMSVTSLLLLFWSCCVKYQRLFGEGRARCRQGLGFTSMTGGG